MQEKRGEERTWQTGAKLEGDREEGGRVRVAERLLLDRLPLG